MTEYVYGIVEATAAEPSGRGIADLPLRLIGGDGAAALVSDLPDGELKLGREALLTHVRVLSDALAHGTVLPMRFGVVMDGPDEVRGRLLERHAAELREQLELLAGKFEVNIRATYEEDALMREVVSQEPEIARLRKALRGQSEDATFYERIRLGELVAAAVERKREADAAAIVEALSLVSEAVEVSPPPDERIALIAAFLVTRDSSAEFDDVLEALARAQAGRIRFKYTGPLPPHSFVQLSQED